MDTNGNNGAQNAVGQSQNATSMYSQNVYGTQTGAQESYSTNAQSGAYDMNTQNTANYQNPYYNNTQINAYNANYYKQAQQAATTGGNYYDSNVSGNVFAEVFVEEDEKPVATLSNGLILNFLSGEGLKNEQAVLTNKRLYYNHREGVINRVSTREMVDVADITGTRIRDNKPYSILIAAIFSLIISGAIASSVNNGSIFARGVIIAIVFLAVFLTAIKKWLFVEYAGGCIKLSVKKYGMNNVIAFQRAIYRIKTTVK